MASSQNTKDTLAKSSSSSTSDFQVRKDQLIQEAQAGIEQLHSNLTCLNNNLQTMGDIGNQFNVSSHLWISFQNAISEDTNDEPEMHSNNSLFLAEFNSSIVEEKEPEEDEKREEESQFEHAGMDSSSEV
ncbi:hypothetical protein [Parasitella parasitica]|uniref:Uncharacterized protein n=1 Tax=Parasitella parasitica TaxID=35722 RepID=A0A0B7NIX8_9FUNG|nr:hypothetical protein [Parasitella parasitica]